MLLLHKRVRNLVALALEGADDAAANLGLAAGVQWLGQAGAAVRGEVLGYV